MHPSDGWFVLRSLLRAAMFVVGCVALRFGLSEYSSTLPSKVIPSLLNVPRSQQ